MAADTSSELAGSTKYIGSYRWSRSDYTRLGRLRHIGRTAFQFLFYLWLDQQPRSYGSKQPPSPEQVSQRRRKRAAWLQESLLDLGPTFIKIGQFFSTRADLFPAEYIEELSKLQDRVPAFDYEQVVAIIQRELDKPIDQVFAEFNPVPVASASLGQVHHAWLHSGEEVAVKVQRPGLQRLFSIDLSILRGIVDYVQHQTPWGKDGRDWVGVYEECRRTLWEEVDYLNEGRNADTFRRNFQQISQVITPRVHWRYTTPHLLTMEYIPGIKVTHFESLTAAGLDRRSIAHLGAQSYLRQVLHHGFFHADPHPGNLAVNPDGALIFYDFGMMGRIKPETKASLMLTFSGIIQQDANLVVQSMVELGALASGSDLGPVRRSVQYMLETYLNQALGEHQEISMAEISDDLYELTYDQPFRFPATFTFVLRSLSSLEALGKSLDPEFNFMDVAQPFAEEIMAQDYPSNPNSLIGQISNQAAQFTNTSLSLPSRIETTLNKLEQGDIRMRVNSVEANRSLRKLSSIGVGAIYTLLFTALLLSATQFLIAGWMRVGGGVLFLAVIAAIALIRVLLSLESSDV
ncbi:MAG: AarF/ABC1/UbiB kinase family protein [Leptolyngbyaceae cyanobacterium MO_188.B28]|nr:AarF/ABC1/UbiB kinase family protein [Leptolyngbyaceae cyanobacterium MO_188.B28]